MSVEDYGRADPEVLRNAGIPHATVLDRVVVGRIKQLANQGEGTLKDPLIDAPRVTLAAPTKIPAPATLRHEWSYAISPMIAPSYGGIYLTGFCKNCQTAFTALLRTNPEDGPEFIRISKLDIPLYGCEYKSH